MNRDTLIMSSAWMDIDDALSACCVCKLWNETLDKPTIWKQLCRSSHLQATNTHRNIHSNLDYKQLALLFSNRTHLQYDFGAPYTSNIGLDNYYVFVEFYRRMKIKGNRRTATVGSYVCESLRGGRSSASNAKNSLLFYIPDTMLVINGANPCASNPALTSLPPTAVQRFRSLNNGLEFKEFIVGDALGDWYDNVTTGSPLRVRVRLCRRDNHKTALLSDNARPHDCETYGKSTISRRYSSPDDEIYLDLSAPEGRKAKSMLHSLTIRHIFYISWLDVEVAPLENEHRKWFSAFLHTGDYDKISEQQMPILREIRSFRCAVSNFSFWLRCRTREGRLIGLTEKEQLKVLLEGLNWR